MPTPSGPDGVAYKRQYGQMIGARIGQMTSSNALRYIASLRTDPRVAGLEANTFRARAIGPRVLSPTG
jgi:hypothetical protein